MTKHQSHEFVKGLAEHLWEQRHAAQMSVGKWSDRKVVDLRTDTGIVGTTWYTRTGEVNGIISFENETIEMDDHDANMLRQLLSSIHIQRILRMFGDEGELVKDYQMGRLLMGVGIRWSRNTPMRLNALHRLDRAIATEVVRTRDITSVHGMALEGRKSHVKMDSDTMGTLVMPKNFGAARKAVEDVLTTRMGEAINGSVRPLPPPIVVEGNGRLTRVLRLCHEALAANPELADMSGMPIRPLVEVHVPELFARHHAATAHADPSEIAAIDAELDEGIEIVTNAVSDALSACASRSRQALSEQIAFLGLRHPRDMLGSSSERVGNLEKTEC